MAVYVDDMRLPYGRMFMCHMVADSPEELLRMADRIGVQRKWLQTDSSWVHFDICMEKKRLALQCGAVQVTRRELVLLIRKWRENTI